MSESDSPPRFYAGIFLNVTPNRNKGHHIVMVRRRASRKCCPPQLPQDSASAPSGEPVVQFSTRLSFSCRQRVKQVANETGKTVRAVVEEAIIEKYGLPDERR